MTDFLSLKKSDKSFRPLGVKFNLNQDALYIISFAKVEIRTSIPASGPGIPKYAAGPGLYPFATIHAVVWPYANTGTVWKITKSS